MEEKPKRPRKWPIIPESLIGVLVVVGIILAAMSALTTTCAVDSNGTVLDWPALAVAATFGSLAILIFLSLYHGGPD